MKIFSRGSGEDARLTSTLASDSPESFWTCVRSKAMPAARWICTTTKRDERWVIVKWTRQSAFKWHRWRRERRLLIAIVHLLSSLKPVLVLWESPSFCFQLSSCFAFCRKKIFPSKRANLSQHHVLHQLIVFVRFILLWINFLLRDTKPRRLSVKLFCGLLYSILQISWTAPLETSLSCPLDFNYFSPPPAQLVGFVFIIGIVQPFPRSTTPLMKTF